MKKFQRKVEAGRSGGYGHYNFHITYPSGKQVTLSNVANAPLYDEIRDLETVTISTSHGVWKQISYLIKARQ